MMAQTKTMQHEWLSLHVYIHDFSRLTHFLVHCLHTLPHDFLRQSFFVRYWLGGPHVRIRFRAHAQRDLLEQKILAYLREHGGIIHLDSESFYRAYTSQLVSEPEHYWHAHASMHYIDYHAEESRYGGAPGLPLCEDFFVRDSCAMLHILTDNEATTIEKILFGYCLALYSALEQCDLQLDFLRAIYDLNSLSELPRYLQMYGLEKLSKHTAQFRTQRQRYLEQNYYPEFVLPYTHHLQNLITQLLPLSGRFCVNILHSLLHMSFNRAGITPAREMHLRLCALLAQTMEDYDEFAAI